MSIIFGKMSSNIQDHFKVDYPCWRWYLSLLWFYIFIPIIFIPIVLLIRGSFSILSCVGLVLFLQLLWIPRLIKDIWVPYAISIEEERILVYTKVGKQVKENPIDIKNLGIKYYKRKHSLTLWEREENRTPSKMFYLSENKNWKASTIKDVVHSIIRISHYPIHYEEV